MSTAPRPRPPIVFIHGLWLHGESWDRWTELFRANGYDAVAASWPGDAPTTAATRERGNALAGYGVTQVADHVAEQLARFDEKPVVIGHSFGGLIAQNLLGRDLASAAIAIDPAPFKGIPQLPFSALRSAFPVLGNPFNFGRSVSLTERQFRYGFTNALPADEAAELYARFAMPAPARPLFQAATATFTPHAATTVNIANATRGPLLLIAGLADHTVPPVLVRSAFKRYRGSGAVTDLKEFSGRGHSLTIDRGWQEIADYSLRWLQAKLP